DGLGIFRESIAGLQFFVDARLPSVHQSLLAGGAHGLRSEIRTLRTDLSAEQGRLREQAALDEIDASAEHTSRFFRAFDDVDADAADLQQAFENWACTVLKLER